MSNKGFIEQALNEMGFSLPGKEQEISADTAMSIVDELRRIVDDLENRINWKSEPAEPEPDSNPYPFTVYIPLSNEEASDIIYNTWLDAVVEALNEPSTKSLAECWRSLVTCNPTIKRAMMALADEQFGRDYEETFADCFARWNEEETGNPVIFFAMQSFYDGTVGTPTASELMLREYAWQIATEWESFGDTAYFIEVLHTAIEEMS